MDFCKRECTVINADRGFGFVMLQDDSDGTHILARLRNDSPIGLDKLFKVTSGFDLIGKKVNIDLLKKKLYPEGGNGKTDFARYNFQFV